MKINLLNLNNNLIRNRQNNLKYNRNNRIMQQIMFINMKCRNVMKVERKKKCNLILMIYCKTMKMKIKDMN